VGTDFWLFFGVVSLLRVLMLVTLQLLNEAQHPVASRRSNPAEPLQSGF
jgi:hypothetical protein